MRINGVAYPTTQHGFARDRVFVCEESSQTTATFLLCSDAETLKRYPFEFELRIRYALENASVSVAWEVRNASAVPMYFTIGGHPAFAFAQPDDRKSDYCLHFPDADLLKYTLLDPVGGGAMPDVVRDLPLTNGWLPLSEELFANDALIMDGGQVNEVWLCHANGTPRVGMRCEGFPNFGVWSVHGAPFVCLEPWVGRCDDCGFDRELSEKPGVACVESGQRFEKRYHILLPEV